MTLIANPPHNKEAVEKEAIEMAAAGLDLERGVKLSDSVLLKAGSINKDGHHGFYIEDGANELLHKTVLINDPAEREEYEKRISVETSIPADDINAAIEVYKRAWENKFINHKAKKYFSPITAAELDDGDFELTYLVDGVIAEGQPLIIAGQFKTLKTSIVFDLGVSLASAHRFPNDSSNFLGRFSVQSRKVMVLTAESGMATVQETCRRICKQKGFHLRDLGDRIIFDDRVPSLANQEHTDELLELLKEREIDVLIADPAYLMIDGENAGNLFSMGTQLRSFAELAKSAGATPVLLHHAKKTTLNATEYQPLELADLAWAGFAEFARQWLLLSRRERYEEGTGNHRLWMSVGGSAGHNGCWGLDIAEGHPEDIGGRRWEITVSEAKQAKESAAERSEKAKEDQKIRTIEKNAQKLRDAFIGVGRNGITQSDAFTKSGLNTSAGRAALGRLLSDDVVEPCDVSKSNGRTYDGYRLTAAAAEKEISDESDGRLFDVS